MTQSGVYSIQNLKTGKKYIGQSAWVLHRIRAHFSQLRRGVHPCADLQEDFEQCGESAFKAEILELTSNAAKSLGAEGYWILQELPLNLYNSAVEIRNSRLRAQRHQQDTA